MTHDGTLRALLAQEVARHRALIDAPDATPLSVRRSLHALRGSAALAGEHDLHLVLTQAGALLRAGDDAVLPTIRQLLGEVAQRLQSDLPALDTRWPRPPRALRASVRPADFSSTYARSVAPHLEQLTALATAAPEVARVEAPRCVHAIKGAAGAASDDVTSWYCHGLEEHLSKLGDTTWPVEDLSHHASLIRTLVDDPEQGLARLRRPTASVPPEGLPPSAPPARKSDDLRVPASEIESIIDRVTRADILAGELSSTATLAENAAARMRLDGVVLREALRQIGPPTPWGAPAQALQSIEHVATRMDTFARAAERGAREVRRGARRVTRAAFNTRRSLEPIRNAQLGPVFDSVVQQTETLAAQEGKSVRWTTAGANVRVDRGAADVLRVVLLQLARNAVAHGIEAPETRRAAGLPAAGSLALSAVTVGGSVRIRVEDDGRGIDLDAVRAQAHKRLQIPHSRVEDLTESELLSLLFLPGFTTRRDADPLAGRGIGLDMALSEVRRLGGSLTLCVAESGRGLRASLELPQLLGPTPVLWVSAGGSDFGFRASSIGRIRLLEDGDATVTLARCLGLSASNERFIVELLGPATDPIGVSVERIRDRENASVRLLPVVATRAGPYGGAVLLGDGKLGLVLNSAEVAARAVALASTV